MQSSSRVASWRTYADAAPEAVASAPDEAGGGALLGEAFVLPERLAFLWDAAVRNELFVVPDARGTGVADDLLDAAVALARDGEMVAKAL